MTIITPGASIPSIPLDRTLERFGQIQKLIFQRKYQTGTTLNTLPVPLRDPKLRATWTALLAAVNSTKVTVSTFIQEPENSAGEARMYGGGNATINGIEIVLGVNPSPFTAKVLETKQHVVKALKQLIAEGANLAVYLVNEHGQIGCLSNNNDGTATEYRPIPIRSFFVGDKVFGNFENVDSNDLSFVFEPNFSNDFDVVTPTDFNPLHDLSNPI